VRDLLDEGVPGEVIRFVFMGTHYRKPMDWTEKKRAEAEATLRKFYAQAAQGVGTGQPYVLIEKALADDLNTAGAIAELHQLSLADDIAELRYSLQFLGLMGDDVPAWSKAPVVDLSTYADHLSRLREAAMENKDFSAVDAMKKALLEAGVEVKMSKQGIDLEAKPGFDPAKLEALK